MKKIILTTAMLFAFGISNAQGDSGIKFGVKAGLNIANQKYSEINADYDKPNTSSRTGFHIGGFAEIKISEKFALQPELLFSTQGSKSDYSEKESFGGGSYSYSSEDKYNLSYLNIPIMAKYYVIEKLSIEVGPQIGFLLSAKDKYSDTETYTFLGDTESDSYSYDFDTKNTYEKIDFSLNFGANYEFTKNIFAGVRYNMGLTDIAKTGNVDEDGETFKVKKWANIKNNVFQISVGYKF